MTMNNIDVFLAVRVFDEVLSFESFKLVVNPLLRLKLSRLNCLSSHA